MGQIWKIQIWIVIRTYAENTVIRSKVLDLDFALFLFKSYLQLNIIFQVKIFCQMIGLLGCT